MDACSRLPWFKVNNTPAVTPSRDGIASMRLAAGKRRSDIQFVCVCMRLWCFCAMCEICNSLLKPVCCLKRAEFQLQLQISLKGRAFMFLWSERAAHYSLPVAFIAHKEKTHFPIRNQIGHTSILSFSCDVYEATDHWPRSDLSAFFVFLEQKVSFFVWQLGWTRQKLNGGWNEAHLHHSGTHFIDNMNPMTQDYFNGYFFFFRAWFLEAHLLPLGWNYCLKGFLLTYIDNSPSKSRQIIV